MTMQLYLVQPSNNDDDSVREVIADFITQRQGFILMATSFGSLIIAIDDSQIEAVKAHYLVEFASGVTLNPNAPGAAALQRLFTENLAAQLVERGLVQPGRAAPGQSGPHVPGSMARSYADRPATAPRNRGAGPRQGDRSGGYPPGYRPLRWSTPPEPDEEGGE